MSHILISVSPFLGHVNPLLALAKHLARRGHSILFNTSDAFREAVEASNLQFIPLKGKANWDYRRLDDFFPERKAILPGLGILKYDLKHVFGASIPDQFEQLKELVERESIDVIISEITFLGYIPLLLQGMVNRPPIIACNILPMLLSSIDISPFAGPDSSPQGRARNIEHTRQFQAELHSSHEYVNQVVRELCGRDLPSFVLDCNYTLPDIAVQCTPAEFEYPRSDKPANLRFVGAILPEASKTFQPPSWWPELDGSRPVVMVTQGTVANSDFSELIQPTLDALAGEDALVVAVAARPEIEEIKATPNGRVVGYLPFDQLLRRADIFVTNGGNGGVQQALSLGVPMVVAGASEDKPQVAARVAWTGSGINLDTTRPTQEQIRSAVYTVLSDPKYRDNAKKFQAIHARYNALDEIERIVHSAVAERVFRSH
jgi:MGT family glycosyltransferase